MLLLFDIDRLSISIWSNLGSQSAPLDMLLNVNQTSWSIQDSIVFQPVFDTPLLKKTLTIPKHNLASHVADYHKSAFLDHHLAGREEGEYRNDPKFSDTV